MSSSELSLESCHVAISRVTSLAAADLDAALLELNAVCQERPDAAEILSESGAAPLLLQWLMQAAYTAHAGGSKLSRTRTTGRKERAWMTLALLQLIASTDDGGACLIACGAVEQVTALLPCFSAPQSNPKRVALVFRIIVNIARKATIPASAALAALEHVFWYMHSAQLELASPSSMRRGDSNYCDMSKCFVALLRAAPSQPAEAAAAASAAAASAAAASAAAAVTRLPYSAVSAFVPLWRQVMQRRTALGGIDVYINRAACDALASIFACGCNLEGGGDNNNKSENGDGPGNCDGAPSDASDVAEQWRSDLADFAASEDFEPMLEELDSLMAPALEMFLDLFDAETFSLAFNERRVELVISEINEKKIRTMKNAIFRMRLFAAFAAYVSGFAQRLSTAPYFERLLAYIDDHFYSDYKSNSEVFLKSTLSVFESVLMSSSDVACAALQLLAAGAVGTCCAFLKRSLLPPPSQEGPEAPPSARRIAQLLHLLNLLICTSDTSPDLTVRDSGIAAWNPFVTEFIACRGLQALELLRYDACLRA